MGDGPRDAGDHRRRASLSELIQDLDADEIGVGGHAAVLHGGLATVLDGQGRAAVAGYKPSHEGAVTGVVVRLHLAFDEVLPADDPAGGEVRVGSHATVENSYAHAASVGAAGGRRRGVTEADGQIGDVHRALVVETVDGVVGDDLDHEVLLGEEGYLVGREIRGDSVHERKLGGLDHRRKGVLYPIEGARRVHQDGHGCILPGSVQSDLDAWVDRVVGRARGQGRDRQGQQTECGYGQDEDLRFHVHRLHTSAPSTYRRAQDRGPLCGSTWGVRRGAFA